MTRTVLLSFICLALAGCSGSRGHQDYRDFDLEWTVRVTDVTGGAETARIWIAIPQELPEQEVSDLSLKTSHPWEVVEDPDFKNKVLQVTVDDPPSEIVLDLAARVRRFPVTVPQPASLSTRERELYLREESLVSLSPRIRELAAKVGSDHRGRYDYVLSVMEYDKSVPGWGFGDSERACDVGKGNCTDYHSLFMSLSRAQGVPAVFEMGYPTSPDGEVNREGGYHCWAWFYRDGAWLPVDISEADKNPERKDFFYGNLDPDRIAFSRGRDVKLPGMEGPPLNYLPSGAYAEVDGVPLGSVTRTLTYRVEMSAQEKAS